MRGTNAISVPVMVAIRVSVARLREGPRLAHRQRAFYFRGRRKRAQLIAKSAEKLLDE